MDPVILARWQFGITTVYHFFFVPITIGLTWLVAIMQTFWYRTGNEQWLRLTKFFGKLVLINFAAGVVTGIVQEFQFGMNWSEYSRFVGDIFGAPLALEALIAFFLESTFIGLWIFGWERLSRRLHLVTIYLVALGSTLSAVFILAANTWMQNPVGAIYRNGRAELEDFSALFTNPFFLVTFPHQIAASFMVAGGLVSGVAGWWLFKENRAAKAAPKNPVIKDAMGVISVPEPEDKTNIWRSALKMGAIAMLLASVAVSLTGDWQAKVETKLQPMKLAASEGLFETTTSAPLSVVAIFTTDGTEVVWSFEVPYLLSFLAHNNPNAEVLGINDLKAQYEADGFSQYDGTRNALQESYASQLDNSKIDHVPNVWVAFYSFRLMMIGLAGTLISALLLWVTRKGRAPNGGLLWTAMFIAAPLLPLFGNSFGWILTEMGRQPWVVMGVLPTYTAVSPTVSAGEMLFSMIGFTLIYGAIAVIVVGLFLSKIRAGLPEVTPPGDPAEVADGAPVYFAY